MDINAFLRDPNNKVALQIIKSMRNGLVYGGRLRFAHSLVVSFLFRRNVPLLKRLTNVLKLTKDHGKVLACFALIYKVALLSMGQLFGDKPIHEFIAGSIGGAIVYGNQTRLFNHSIAHQISLYCGARVILALGKLLAYKIAKISKESQFIRDKKHIRSHIQKNSWTAFASLTWGLVMYLHRYYPSYLQHSLESSMIYIYDDWKWDDWRSFLGV